MLPCENGSNITLDPMVMVGVGLETDCALYVESRSVWMFSLYIELDLMVIICNVHRDL